MGENAEFTCEIPHSNVLLPTYVINIYIPSVHI